MTTVAMTVWVVSAPVAFMVGHSSRSWWLACLFGPLVVLLGGLGCRRFMRSDNDRNLGLVLGLLVLVALVGVTIHAEPVHHDPLRELAGTSTSFRTILRIEGLPSSMGSSAMTGQDRAQQRWQVAAVTERGSQVLLNGQQPIADQLVPGSQWLMDTRVSRQLTGRRQVVALQAIGTARLVQSATGWMSKAEAVRADTQAASRATGHDVGLFPAMVLGDETTLDPEARTVMQQTGLTHLTAVSGANLGIIAVAVLGGSRLLRLRRRPAVLVTAVVVMGFVTVVGPQPSVIRATGMTGLLLFALALHRAYSAGALLASAVTVLVLFDPFLSVSPGFGMSVAATAALVAVSRSMSDGQPPQTVRAAGQLLVASCIAAWAASSPIAALIGSSIPLAGVLANVLVAPLVPVVTVSGTACAVASQLLGASALPVRMLAAIGGRTCDVLLAIANWVLSLGLPSVPTTTTWQVLGVCAFSTALLVALFAHRRLLARLGTQPWRWLLALGVALALLTRIPATAHGVPSGWVVVACDVGQGDALIVRSNTGPGHAVVVDVGPTPDAIDRCLKRWGVTVVDLLVLSHFHVDHVGGLAGLLRHRTVGPVVTSPLAEPIEQVQGVNRLLTARGISATALTAGAVQHVGNLRLEVLWPSRFVTGGSAPNNASVVLLATVAGVRMLLTGDIEPPAQAELIANHAGVAVDVVKVPHHGSRNADLRLPQWTHARIALISVGAHNTYGHPAASTVAMWEQAGALVGRTDQQSDLAVVMQDGQLGMVTREKVASP